MASLKSLAKDTAIYGLSSIIGRLLNYLLTPMYTYKLAAATGGYGVVTHLYAYTALLLVLLTFGMETTFFRFMNKEGENPKKVFGTALWAVGTVSFVFAAGVCCLQTPISAAFGYADTPSFVSMMAVVVALDAFQSILFAYLRFQHRALKFAALKLLFILLSVGANFYVYCIWGSTDVFYVFFINLLCTASITLFFLPEMRSFPWAFDRALLRRMLSYGWPILLLGLAGILNQAGDKIILPAVLGNEEGRVQLGIYGACFKVAMIIAMLTQAFRYAYEPFVFAANKDAKSRTETYGVAMKYFIAFSLLAYVAVMAYLPVLQYIVGADYREGLRVVPIVMAGEVLMGVYFNLSFWYKLSDRTIWGAICSFAGCATLILFNILLIPSMGYMACAWSGVLGYAVAAILSYLAGRHYYPIPYPWWSILSYVLLTAFCCAIMSIFAHFIEDSWLRMGFNSLVCVAFLAHIAYYEFLRPRRRLRAV